MMLSMVSVYMGYGLTVKPGGLVLSMEGLELHS